MNGFELASTVEERGMERLRPFLHEKAFDGRYVRTAKGPLARELQQSFGDVLMNTDDKTVLALEIKVETRWTGNLFLETWSNRNLDRQADHSERGSNPGWLITQRADMLFYYFLDVDALIVTPMFRLKQWCLGTADVPGRIYEWTEKPQKKYKQMNDSWGRCVPIEEIKTGVPLKTYNVAQMSLWPE